jgi:heme A synthase
MSGNPQRPLMQTILISLVMTAALVAIAWLVWTYVPRGFRSWGVTRGTLLTDLRFFVGLLAVFLVLTLLDRIIEFVKGKLGGGY